MVDLFGWAVPTTLANQRRVGRNHPRNHIGTFTCDPRRVILRNHRSGQGGAHAGVNAPRLITHFTIGCASDQGSGRTQTIALHPLKRGEARELVCNP